MATWPMVHAPDSTVHCVVCGSRTWIDCRTVAHWLEALRGQYPILTVIEGGAKGADACCAFWASRRRDTGIHWIQQPAYWQNYPPETRWKAGHDRNQRMINMLTAATLRDHGAILVAFKAELDPRLASRPESATGGTEDIIRRAWAANIPVWWTADTTAPRPLIAPSALTLFF